MKKPKRSQSLAPQQIIERFVKRARRIEAHSLVRSGEAEKYSTRKGTISFDRDGSLNVHDDILEDEEALESLAARLRPFIVGSESIYLKEVISVIKACATADSLTASEGNSLEDTEKWFVGRYEKKTINAYSVQRIASDGAPLTKYLSDALLAESWAYIDLVHADPNHEKAAALELGYYDRYAAASTYFCEFALKVVDVLNIVKVLAERNALQIDSEAWEEPVIYEEAKKAHREEVISGAVYIFPAGFEPPLGTKLDDIPGAVEATPILIGMLAQPEGKAFFVAFDEEDNQTTCYPAFREVSGERIMFLIDDALRLTVPTSAFSSEHKSEVTLSMDFVKGSEAYASKIVSSMIHPNSGELHFNIGEEHLALKIQLPQPRAFGQAGDDVE